MAGERIEHKKNTDGTWNARRIKEEPHAKEEDGSQKDYQGHDKGRVYKKSQTHGR